MFMALLSLLAGRVTTIGSKLPQSGTANWWINLK